MFVLTAEFLLQIDEYCWKKHVRTCFTRRCVSNSGIIDSNNFQGTNKRMCMHGDGAPTVIRPGVRGRRPTYLSFANDQIDSVVSTTHRQIYKLTAFPRSVDKVSTKAKNKGCRSQSWTSCLSPSNVSHTAWYRPKMASLAAP
jgi:hypothetical protein